MPRQRIPRDLAKARQLRAELTLPEVLLWNLLRRSPQGVRFRRQYPVDVYVIDFYSAKAKVGVEVDGMAHDMGDNPARDAVRAARIKEFGIELLRIPASDVLRSPEAVAEAIVRYCHRS